MMQKGMAEMLIKPETMVVSRQTLPPAPGSVKVSGKNMEVRPLEFPKLWTTLPQNKKRKQNFRIMA